MKPGELAPLPDLFFEARRFFHFEGVEGVGGVMEGTAGSLKEKARARLAPLMLVLVLLRGRLVRVVGVAGKVVVVWG